MQYSARTLCTILHITVAASLAHADSSAPSREREPRPFEVKCGKRLVAARAEGGKLEPLFHAARIGLLPDGVALSWLDLRVTIRENPPAVTAHLLRRGPSDMDPFAWYIDSDGNLTAHTHIPWRSAARYAQIIFPDGSVPPPWLLRLLTAAADDCLK